MKISPYCIGILGWQLPLKLRSSAHTASRAVMQWETLECNWNQQHGIVVTVWILLIYWNFSVEMLFRETSPSWPQRCLKESISSLHVLEKNTLHLVAWLLSNKALFGCNGWRSQFPPDNLGHVECIAQWCIRSQFPEALLPIPSTLGEATSIPHHRALAACARNFLVFETTAMELLSTQTHMCKWKKVQSIHFCACSSVILRECRLLMIT